MMNDMNNLDFTIAIRRAENSKFVDNIHTFKEETLLDATKI